MFCLRRLQWLLPAALLVLLLPACGNPPTASQPGAGSGGTSTPTDSTPAPAGTPATASLAGTQWVLTGYGPAAEPIALPEGARVTADFTGDQVGGTAACNSYSGSYTASDGSLTVGALVQTEMACLREDLMALERVFLQALGAATAYAVDGDTLTIDYDGGVLRFTRSAPQATLPLEGTPWELSAFGTGESVSSLITGSRITAEFTQGQVVGSTGCNEYGGSYSLQETAITFGEIVTTKVACAEEIMAQERAFLEALQTAKEMKLEGRELRIEHAGGTLYFTAAG